MKEGETNTAISNTAIPVKRENEKDRLLSRVGPGHNHQVQNTTHQVILKSMSPQSLSYLMPGQKYRMYQKVETLNRLNSSALLKPSLSLLCRVVQQQ